MRRTIPSLALAVVMLIGAAPAAFALGGQAPDAGCQPGPTNEYGSAHLEEWRSIDFDEFVVFLMDRYGIDEDRATERATITFDFCDHNENGSVCLTLQHNPNDASGYADYWLVEDDHPFGGG